MYLRIVRPVPETLEGFDVRRFRLLGRYEVQIPLCDLLVLDGYAIPETEAPPSRDAAIKAIASTIVPVTSPTVDLVRQSTWTAKPGRRTPATRKRQR